MLRHHVLIMSLCVVQHALWTIVDIAPVMPTFVPNVQVDTISAHQTSVTVRFLTALLCLVFDRYNHVKHISLNINFVAFCLLSVIHFSVSVFILCPFQSYD